MRQTQNTTVGVTLDNDVSFRSHVVNIAAKYRTRSWVLGRLRKKGLKEEKLITTYKTLVRPSLEYAAPAWHSLLTAGQAALLERQQVQSLRNIYGQGLSANKMRQKADIDLLSKRRETISKRFAVKCLTNERSAHWFQKRAVPTYSRRQGVNYPTYRENFARTDRHKNTPMNYLVKKLNEPI